MPTSIFVTALRQYGTNFSIDISISQFIADENDGFPGSDQPIEEDGRILMSMSKVKGFTVLLFQLGPYVLHHIYLRTYCEILKAFLFPS